MTDVRSTTECGRSAEQFGDAPSEHARIEPLFDSETSRFLIRNRARLARTIEGEIIPRLMLAHRGGFEGAEAVAGSAGEAVTVDIDGFARLVMSPDAGAAAAHVALLRRNGLRLEQAFLELFVPAARHLGEMWTNDRCSFTDVTVGLCRLQQLVHELSPAFEQEAEHREHGRRLLLTGYPGERHTFGLVLVEEFFRRAGWEVVCETPASVEELIDLVRCEWFAVAGLSLSTDSLLDELASVIRNMRKASLNAGIGVLVGGRVFLEHPEWVQRVGADATAVDGRHAVLQAQGLVQMMERRC